MFFSLCRMCSLFVFGVHLLAEPLAAVFGVQLLAETLAATKVLAPGARMVFRERCHVCQDLPLENAFGALRPTSDDQEVCRVSFVK